MKYCITKIDAAVNQLDWAIKLFLDHKAYVPAITLAGAAEELIGEILNNEAAFRELQSLLSSKYNLDPKIVSQEYLNKAKNWLKHWKNCKDNDCIELELETEAMQYIIRAISNLFSHNCSLTSESPRFLKWLYENRKDIF
ncbi:MAG: hypothetical protein EPN22_10435 [Nitrospirae bacterium]|nr:MAG: hypothetical protein EPN22_10435 [Nitrospirota bacterium]